jgi:hypothetical protein
MGSLPRRIARDEKGQSLLEMALMLPILLLLLLGIIQFGFVFSGQIALAGAAREGARLAATGAADMAVRQHVQAILAASPLLSDLQVDISPAGTKVFGGQVTVRLLAKIPVIVPLPLALPEGAFSLTAEAVMRVEKTVGGMAGAIVVVSVKGTYTKLGAS